MRLGEPEVVTFATEQIKVTTLAGVLPIRVSILLAVPTTSSRICAGAGVLIGDCHVTSPKNQKNRKIQPQIS
jgi:hypothetical protein